MSSLLAEACLIASHDATLFPVPRTEAVLAAQAGEVLVTQLKSSDPFALPLDLSLVAAGESLPDDQEKPPVQVRHITELAALGGDCTLSSQQRVGALTVLSCLAAAYSPLPQANARLDALSSASFSALRHLSHKPDTKQGVFATAMLDVLVTYGGELADDAATFLGEVADLQSTVAESAPEAAKRWPVRIELANLTALERINWINQGTLPEKYYGEVVQVEGKTVALVCNLTGYNRRTEELATDVNDNGQYQQAWRYARMGAVKLARGQAQPRLKHTPLPIYWSGNLNTSSVNFLRTYYAQLGNQDGVPVYGVLAMIRTKDKQDKFLSIATSSPRRRSER